MTAPDPNAVLLTRQQVAERLGWDVKKVDKARRAIDPQAWPRPMPGWKQSGPNSRPSYRLPESRLIEYIDGLPDA